MKDEAAAFAAGQVWRYRTPPGFEQSRLVIGAIATFTGDRRIVCVCVNDAPQRQPDGTVAPVAIAFLPMSEEAFAATVTSRDEAPAALNPEFAAGFSLWQNDARGLTCFTVPYEGHLDHMIARQMSAIIGPDAA